jgi:hypothetical protein
LEVIINGSTIRTSKNRTCQYVDNLFLGCMANP